LSEDAGGVVRAVFPDGTITELPPGGLEAGKCGCGALGVCRHVVGLALAYQQQRPTDASPGASSAGEPTTTGPEMTAPKTVRPAETAPSTAGPAVGWSPGDFSDAQLEARVGGRMLAAARRTARTGYVARVHRGRAADPVPTVELPTATVRFLVPLDLGFARTDAVAGVRDDVLALAVWAFRVADAQAPGEADVQVQVGGDPAASADRPGLERAVRLAATVLREGAVHLGAGVGAEVATVRRELEAARMRWPLLAVDDLVTQLDAYRDRGARYRPEALADRVAELFARHRTVTRGGAALASRVLGTDEASETPLRRARLDGLGVRVSAAGDERTVDVFLAHADSSAVLVLRRSYTSEDTGPALGERRVAGVTVRALGSGAVVTESASRSASRTVRLGARRLSRTEALVSRGSWQDLPRSLLAPDLNELAAELDALPPRPIRARVEAELVRVVPIAEVRAVTYAPGAQRVDAVIADAAGVTATVTAVHASCAPGRLDAVVAALTNGARFVAGSVRRGGGGVVIDPIGFAGEMGESGIVVPDLAPAERAGDPGDRPGPVADPIGRALDEALGLLAEMAHRGLLHLPPATGTRLRAAADRLTAVGLRRAAADLSTLGGLLGPDPGAAAVEAWVDAYLRVSTASDLRP
ncbi:MAG: hypothetical protein ABW046_03850, partial [Actinoplanes sp.]